MAKEFHEKASKKQQWSVVGGVFLIFGIMGSIGNPQQPISSFFLLGGFAGFCAWVMATESAAKLAKAMNLDSRSSTSNQQKTINSNNNNEPTKICSSCGWKNPKSNSYCHDCGSELTTDSSSNQGD